MGNTATETMRGRTGSTLIELMIASAVFAVALLSVFGYQFTVDSLRTSNLSRVMQTVAINNMVNLIDGTNWDELGRTQRPWSLSRIRGGGSGTFPALTLSDLLGMNLVSSETGMFAGSKSTDASIGVLRFYVEYYRSTSNLDAAFNSIGSQPGLLDTPATSMGNFATGFAANAAACRIVPSPTVGLSDSTVLTPGNPILVRLVAVNVDPAVGQERVLAETFLGSGTAPQ